MSFLPELLSPAGSFDAGVTAFAYGADAIYLGLPQFSARADAQNVTVEELEQLLAYGRQLEHPRKIYITMNTLVHEHECADAIRNLGLLSDLGVDGVIIQDLGFAELAKCHFPKLERHASTQLACMSSDGAKVLKDLGFSRIVTGRELSLKEAAAISRNCGLEVEVFVHGALCYGVSGLCLFSALDMGIDRSGNRGRCAYCCRRALTPCDASGSPLDQSVKCHPFSMCDLTGIGLIDEMTELGLASLKIEGRMKSPLYVAAVTDLYRGLLDHALTPAQVAAKSEDLKTIFSRPWTELYTLDKQTPPEAIIDPLSIGHRGAPIGRVIGVIRDRVGSRWVKFKTSRALEKHDGIQIDLPHGGRPVGFAIGAMRLAGGRGSQISVPANTLVEIEVIADVAQMIEADAVVYCSASQAVRRAFQTPTLRASENRLLQPLDVTVTLRADACEVEARGVRVSEVCSLNPAKNPAGTHGAIEKAFSRMGDDGFALGQLTVNDPDALYAPASILNQARRQLSDLLRQDVEADQTDRIEAAQEALPQVRTNEAAQATEAHYTVKVRVDCPEQLLTGQVPEAWVVALAIDTPWSALEPWLTRGAIRVALPLMTLDDRQATLEATLRAALAAGVVDFEVPDLSALHLLRRIAGPDAPLRITADWSLYALNPIALQVQHDLGLVGGVTAPEDPWANIGKTALPNGFTREILTVAAMPSYMSFTKPLSPSPLLQTQKGEFLHIFPWNGLHVTSGEQPRCFAPKQEERLAAGFAIGRIDLSWAPPAILEKWAKKGRTWAKFIY